MTIQYPNKLDPKRKIYFAIDNVYGGTGSPTSADRQIQNTIVNKLKAAGLNVVKSEMGPATLYNNMIAVYNAGETNAIMFHVVNGVDPSNIREVALNGNDNRGRITRSRGNDVVMGYFWNSCDPTPGGRCADHVRGSETGGGMSNPGPAEYMVNNKIYAISACSDERTKMDNADYTGDKIAQKFIDLFNFGDDSTPTPTPITPTPDDGDTNKTISTRTITKYYTSPYYEEIFKAKTDENGAFKVKPRLPYKGKYKVHIRYGGDKTHNSSTNTAYIFNFSNESATFKEKLLQTTTVTTYTDSTNTTTTEGSIGKEKNLKKVVTTEKYENGVLKETTSKTSFTHDIIEDSQNTTPGTIPDQNSNDTTPNTIPDDSNNNVGTKINPFNQNIPLLNNRPDVARMAINNKEFEWVDTTKCYVLSEAQFTAVMNRDSRTLQVNNYKNSKYTFFETNSSNKYVVLEREQWNCIEESLHAYRVEYNGDYDSRSATPRSWPKFVNIDFVNKRTICYTDEKDVVQEVTSLSDEEYKRNYTGIFEHWWDGNNTPMARRNYHWLSDAQDTGYTCGPTASSMCLQVLHCYIPETTLAGKMGTTTSGTGPTQIRDGLNKYSHLKAEVVSSNKKEVAKNELLAGRPYVAHMYNHYFALTDLFLEQDKLLICNSGRSGGATGWHSWSSQSQGFDFGQTVKIKLNYTIDEKEKNELLNCVGSMGGSWTRPYNQEKVRRYSRVG